MMNIRSLRNLASGLKAGEFSAQDIAKECLKNISARDGEVKAFLKYDAERLLATATAADERRAKGQALSDFDGIPIGIKDNIVVEGETCSCASKILEKVVSPYDATVIKMLKSKGFIPFGRLNMDEFAMGSSCENSAFQKTCNPLDTSRVPGGSSGGSAACVAAGYLPVALGSDTGGSIRQPAAFCGVVGVKPTYGRVSRYGLVAFASSLDQIGPFANNVDDAGILLDAIAGYDTMDATSLNAPVSSCEKAVCCGNNGSLKGMKIGLPKEYFEGKLSPEVEKVMQVSLDQLRAAGAELVELSLPHTKYAIAVYYILATAEASANLARFDGMRYGTRVAENDLTSTYFASRGNGFGTEVKRRILLGTYVLSSGYYDAYYLKAQKVRTLIKRDFAEAFQKCDALFTPVTPTSAFKFGEKSDPLQMYLSDIFTISLNLSGCCGISLPAGVDADNNMPIGVQFMAPELGEETLFKVASAFETISK